MSEREVTYDSGIESGPAIGGTGEASTLDMSNQAKAAARRREQARLPFGFGVHGRRASGKRIVPR